MIYLLVSLIAISFLGMLYFMKQVKDGEISLSEKSWHFKLLKYMWDVDVDSLTNMCPYYWSVVCSVIILAPYLIIRYFMKAIEWIHNLEVLKKVTSIKIKKPLIIASKKESKPLFTIPQSKKDIFSLIWRKGSYIFDIFLIVAIFLSAAILLASLVYRSFSFNFMFGIYLLSAMIYALSILVSYNYPKYKEIMLEPWVKFFKGLFGIVSQPFKLIWQLLLKLFNVYENLCPAINWESKSNNN